MIKVPLKQRKIFFYSSFIALIVVSILIIMPFMQALAAAMVFAFIFRPIYDFLMKKWDKPNINSFLCVILVVLVVVGPLALVLNTVVKESTVSYIELKQLVYAPKKDCLDDSAFCFYMNEFKDFLKDPKIAFYMQDSFEKFTIFTTEKVSGFVVSIPKIIINFIILIIALFYFFRDGKVLIERLERLLPLTESSRKKIFNQFNNMSKAIVYGYVVAALFQGLVALIGFYAINYFFADPYVPLISAPLLWASILTVFSMIPVLGAASVWLPMSLFMFFTSYSSGNEAGITAAITLMVYGLLVISSVDNFVRPWLAGKQANVHPLLIFLGVFGGVITIGVMGILLGPLVLALIVTYLKVYEEGTV